VLWEGVPEQRHNHIDTHRHVNWRQRLVRRSCVFLMVRDLFVDRPEDATAPSRAHASPIGNRPPRGHRGRDCLAPAAFGSGCHSSQRRRAPVRRGARSAACAPTHARALRSPCALARGASTCSALARLRASATPGQRMCEGAGPACSPLLARSTVPCFRIRRCARAASTYRCFVGDRPSDSSWLVSSRGASLRKLQAAAAAGHKRGMCLRSPHGGTAALPSLAGFGARFACTF
jgi:hypothetical protein